MTGGFYCEGVTWSEAPAAETQGFWFSRVSHVQLRADRKSTTQHPVNLHNKILLPLILQSERSCCVYNTFMETTPAVWRFCSMLDPTQPGRGWRTTDQNCSRAPPRPSDQWSWAECGRVRWTSDVLQLTQTECDWDVLDVVLSPRQLLLSRIWDF